MSEKRTHPKQTRLPPSRNKNSVLTPPPLRQRRARIRKDEEDTEHRHTDGGLRPSGATRTAREFRAKRVIVIGTAIVVTIVALLNYARPAVLFRRTGAPPPLHMATLYPPSVIMDRDLPRFFRTFSIATPSNEYARKAAVGIIRSRRALNHGTGHWRVILKAWDLGTVRQLIERSICGHDFDVAYQFSTQERQNDLVMWCLLTTRISEGFFLDSVEMISNAFDLNKKRGMVVRTTKSTRRLSNAYYLHPRLPGDGGSDAAPLPSRVLSWLLDNPESSLEDPAVSLQETIYQLVSQDEHRDRYLYLEEICQEFPHQRAIAKQCRRNHDHPGSDTCCYFVVPEGDGGNLRMTAPERNLNLHEQQRLMRESSNRDDADSRL